MKKTAHKSQGDKLDEMIDELRVKIFSKRRELDTLNQKIDSLQKIIDIMTPTS